MPLFRSRAVVVAATAKCTAAGADIIMAGAGAVVINTDGAAANIAVTDTTDTPGFFRSRSSSPLNPGLPKLGLGHLHRTHEIGTMVKELVALRCDRFLSLSGRV